MADELDALADAFAEDPSAMDRKSLVDYIIQLKEANAVLERRLQEGA